MAAWAAEVVGSFLCGGAGPGLLRGGGWRTSLPGCPDSSPPASGIPRRVSEIAVEAIVQYREMQLSDNVGTISSMFNWDVEHRLIDHNPVQGVKLLPHDRPKKVDR